MDIVPTGCAVRVEVLFLRVDEVDATLGYRFAAAALPGGQPPDDAAADLAGVGGRLVGVDGRRVGAGQGDEVSVLHSTSWRYEAGAGLVLTYAALPDPDPLAAASVLSGPAVVASGDPLRPSPELLHAHHVAAHAVRHLADLARRDPGVSAVARGSRHRALFDAVAAAAEDTPTGTHAAVHAVAAAGRSPSRRAGRGPRASIAVHLDDVTR